MKNLCLGMLIMIAISAVLLGGCSSTAGNRQATMAAVKATAHLTLDIVIDRQVQSGKIAAADRDERRAQTSGALDTFIADLTAHGVVAPEERAAARAGLADILVKSLGVTSLEASDLVNTFGDLVVNAITPDPPAPTTKP